MAETALSAIPQDQLEDLSPEERRELAELYRQELEISREGVDLQPIRFKINKEACAFIDPMGDTHKELRGIIVFKQKIRGYWNRAAEDNIPECFSHDGRIGIRRDSGEEHSCADCALNQWGSGEDEAGNPTKGKACKEMRRIFLVIEGYHLPIVVVLPPTSIKAFDRYESARLTQGIPDIARETIITLTLQHGAKYTYAVANFRVGEPVPPGRMLELKRMRNALQPAAETMEIGEDDYMNGEALDADEEPF